MKQKKVLCVVGTRPEAIKMAPVINRLKEEGYCDLKVLSTAQHREILDQMLKLFGIAPDIDLNIMKQGQTLAELTANLMPPLEQCLKHEKPDLVLAQGDTTTAFLVSLSCFYQQIAFGHVEAGIRTGEFFSPFPEEMNRVLISRLSSLNFAPTEQARQNLLEEGFDAATIYVTGNTVIDALFAILKLNLPLDLRILPDRQLLLVTAHRRENFGEKLENICHALRVIVENNPQVQLLYPVHPNPHVRGTVYPILSNHPRILLTEPLPYGVFVTAMKKAHFIISDSGGVQEEAPALGKPVLILRESTERPEAVRAGSARLVGADPDSIITSAQELLDSPEAYRKMVSLESPYGDGKAAKRIAGIIKQIFEEGY